MMRLSLTIAALAILAACGSSHVADVRYAAVPASGWDRIDSREITLLAHADSADTHGLALAPVVCVRHNEDYPYNDLRLEFTTIDDRGFEHRDTVTIHIYRPDNGRPLGRGDHGLYEVFDTLPPIRVDHLPLTFTVAQAMTDDLLPGIDNVGIMLIKK